MSPRGMTRYVFDIVKARYFKSVPCATCGKRVKRSRVFDETLNPFNVRDDGTPKSRTDIYASLRVKAEAWMAEPDYCTNCRREALRTGVA